MTIKSIQSIKNFLPPVDGAPATAGQPDEAEVRALVAAGTEVVINLGILDPRYCLPDEAGLVLSLGMAYHHLPVAFDAPTRDDLARFFGLMEGAGERSVLVHCAANYRAICFVALLGEARLGWTRKQADVYISRVWKPDPVWKDFLAMARQSFEGTGS